MRRTLCLKFYCSPGEREGLYLHMYYVNVQQNPLCAASCVTKDIPIPPRFSSPTIFYRDANSVLSRAHLCTAAVIGSMRRTLCSKLYCSSGERKGLFTHVLRECSAEPSMRSILCLKGYSHPSPVFVAYGFLSPGKFSTLQWTVFDTPQGKLMHPAD